MGEWVNRRYIVSTEESKENLKVLEDEGAWQAWAGDRVGGTRLLSVDLGVIYP